MVKNPLRETLRNIKPQADDFLGKPRQVLDLSRNKSLRKLEITAGSLIEEFKYHAPTTVSNSYKAVLATIKSPAFSDFVVVYGQLDFYEDKSYRHTKTRIRDPEAWYHRQFEVFRAMYKAQDYRLVLSLIRTDGHSMRELERAVAAERAKGGLPLRIEISHTPGPY